MMTHYLLRMWLKVQSGQGGSGTPQSDGELSDDISDSEAEQCNAMHQILIL